MMTTARPQFYRVVCLFALALACVSAFAENPGSDSAAPPASEIDYWEKNPKLWSQITTQRKILVSAKNEDGQTKSRGAGLVKAEVADVWAFTTNPEKIKSTSRFLKNFTWDQETGAVDMQIELLMVSYRLLGTATQMPDPENPKISFQVLEGTLVPFSAELEIRSVKAQAARPGAPTFPAGHTLVRITGTSAKDRALSWPLRVALEAVLQRTAGYLREAVEADIRRPKTSVDNKIDQR